MSTTLSLLNYIMPSDSDTTADNNTPPINSVNSFSEPVSDISNFEIPFDKNTPFWVPILLRSFDALKNDIQSNVLALSEEVKSINAKFESSVQIPQIVFLQLRIK